MPGILLAAGLLLVYWRHVVAVLGISIVVLAVVGRLKRRRGAIGFVHPDSGGGGGGERVLWVALARLLSELSSAPGDGRHAIRTVVLYTLWTEDDNEKNSNNGGEALASTSGGKSGSGHVTRTDAAAAAALLHRVKSQFNIDVLPTGSRVEFRVELLSPRIKRFLDPRTFPVLTLLLQSIAGALALFASIVLGPGACDVMVDTVGVPFAYPLFTALCGARVATYTHYPTISTDMIARVAQRRAAYNNSGSVARSGWRSRAKLLYYRAFAWLYRAAGWFPAVVMTNSSWTTAHIATLWGRRPTVVFPPVDIARLHELPLERERRGGSGGLIVVSIAQFRPEKNHELQVRAFAAALPRLPSGSRLHLVGGARNAEDRERVAQCAALCRDVLQLGDAVAFHVSCPREEVVALLASGDVGLHAMEDEHFGIGVVEYIAAGLVPLAHNSAGPAQDIVVARDHPAATTTATTTMTTTTRAFGELATTETEFAEALVRLARLRAEDPAAWRAAQLAGREHSRRFSDEHFGTQFVAALRPLFSALRSSS